MNESEEIVLINDNPVDLRQKIATELDVRRDRKETPNIEMFDYVSDIINNQVSPIYSSITVT